MPRPTPILAVLAMCLGLLAATTTSASAAGESWTVDSVNSAGCGNSDIDLGITFGGLDTDEYVFRTRAIVGGQKYMDQLYEGAFGNTSTTWGIFPDDTYDPGSTVPFPMPAGKPVTIYLELQRPLGTVLLTRRLVLASCSTTTVLSNTLTGQDADSDLVTVPTDKCDSVYGPAAADGCPTLKREVKASYNSRKDLLKGRVGYPASARTFNGLLGDVKLTVYRKQAGKDPAVLKLRSRPNGAFKVPASLSKGTYYIVAGAAFDPDFGRAAKTKSKPFKVT